jgi:hypothetical protein
MATVASKLPRRGYRFVQETLVMIGKEISLLTITVDCATEFSEVCRVTRVVVRERHREAG